MLDVHLQKRLQEVISKGKRPLIVILGPTASGKTDFSLELAVSLGEKAEIVNADSRQLYTHLDIGTAKIRSSEMRGIPHHLFNIVDPKEEVTAARYKREAERVINEIHARGNVPMLVGGSMLYISAIIDGLDFSGPGDPRKSKNLSDYDLFIFGINRPRDMLMTRINERTKKLIESGWIEEVRGLMEKGYGPTDPGMKSHGYREIMAFLKGEITSKEELAEMIASKTRQYAKRQMTWWRGDSRIQWIMVAD